MLSRTGKLVMLKNVVQAIPAYAMSCFLIPKSLCQEIERVMNAFWWQSQSQNSKDIRWLGWRKMCMTKNEGGLGFRDITGFNLALLGKQCWKLLHEPNVLVSQILKAKYYPDCHFLQAGRTSGVSYTWSGIWEAKEEMKKGLRWIIGDGTLINAASDRWLRTNEGFCVNSDQISSQVLQLRVCDLFQEGRKQWNEEMVKQHFSTEDADVILCTRIPQRSTTVHRVEKDLAIGVAANGGNDKQVNDRKWKPPDAGYSKINVDASVYEGHHSFAVGMVLREGHGKYIAGKVMRCEGQVSVLEAEVSCIVEALLWALENTEGLVSVESDSLLGVRALNQGLENLLEIGDLINQGVDMLRSNDRLSVSFVRKQANKVAHSMARVPCQINTSIVLMSPPSYLLETILAESLMI
ncbi:hypothetical protein AgCh_012282 [Apium graveolens]